MATATPCHCLQDAWSRTCLGALLLGDLLILLLLGGLLGLCPLLKPLALAALLVFLLPLGLDWRSLCMCQEICHALIQWTAWSVILDRNQDNAIATDL